MALKAMEYNPLRLFRTVQERNILSICRRNYKMVRSIPGYLTIITFSELIARFGLPQTITTDGAKCYCNVDFEAYCKKLSIRHLAKVLFHPASNGCANFDFEIVKQFLNKCSSSLSHL